MSQFPLWLVILIGLMIYATYNFEIIEAPPFAGRAAPHDFRNSERFAEPPDFNISNSWENLYVSSIIAKELVGLNESEIKDYPFSDLPSKDIKAVFMILDSGNITKVLLNIPVNEIKEIQNKLSEEEFNNILNRVSIENQTQIKERINNN